MTGFPLIDDVRPLIGPFELRLRKVLEDAWNEDWLKTVPEDCRSRWDATTRANVMFNFVRHRALAEFHGDDGVKAIPSGRSVKFLLGNRVLVRMKKASPKSGLASNIPTQATLEFINHPQYALFDNLNVYCVDVLYVEDSFATRIESIIAACRWGLKKLWSYEIQGAAEAAGGTVIPMPQRPTDGSPPPPLVRPRDKADEESGEKPIQ
jgi:hypothetical protein